MTDDTVAKKSLGQHWLKDKASLEAICDAANVTASDTVLEIGPGTGYLTEVLASRQARIIALEFDRDLIKHLRNKVDGWQVELIQGDIRTFDLNKLANGYKIVANIPYYLTANLLRTLVDTKNKPALASLLVQKEVAERVAAMAGQMSFISAAVQLVYDVDLGPVVPAELFTPPPKVDSQVLILKMRPIPLYNDVNYLKLLKFIKIGFGQPRKTLVNNFLAAGQFDREKFESMLASLHLKPTVRAQELTLDQWHELYLQNHSG